MGRKLKIETALVCKSLEKVCVVKQKGCADFYIYTT